MCESLWFILRLSDVSEKKKIEEPVWYKCSWVRGPCSFHIIKSKNCVKELWRGLMNYGAPHEGRHRREFISVCGCGGWEIIYWSSTGGLWRWSLLISLSLGLCWVCFVWEEELELLQSHEKTSQHGLQTPIHSPANIIIRTPHLEPSFKASRCGPTSTKITEPLIRLPSVGV